MPSEQTELADTQLETDLLDFYDEFVAFQDNCAFMCDAVACLIEDQNRLDATTAAGASRYCLWIKHRVKTLKDDLQQIHEKAWLKNRR